MNYLFLLRGVFGAKDDVYIPEKYKLLTINPDKERADFGGLSFSLDGKAFISREEETKVWKNIFEKIENRMKKGSTVIIDDMYVNKKDINQYKDLTEKYGYKTIIIDFSKVSLKQLLTNNRKKPEYKIISEKIIIQKYKELMKTDIPKWIYKNYDGTVFSFNDILDELKKETVRSFNTEKYKKVHVIGDIHGMYKEFKKLTEDIDWNNDFIIFLGDYFDRFQNEIEFLKLFNELYKLSKKENVVLLKGNHEKYKFILNDYKEITEKIKRLKTYSNDLMGKKEKMLKMLRTRAKTVLTLEKHNMLEKLIKFEKRLRNYYAFENNGVIYNFNHGGFVHSLRNKNWIFFNEDDFIEGSGTYGDEFEMAKNFSKMYPLDFLFHGHRDPEIKGPYYKGISNVFNLNGAAERGYDLRKANIDIKENKIFAVKRIFSQRQTKSIKHLEDSTLIKKI